MDSETMVNVLWDAALRFSEAQDRLERALAAEGTPALKDAAGSYFQALTETINAMDGAHRFAFEQAKT